MATSNTPPKTTNTAQPDSVAPTIQKTNMLAIIGLLTAFFVPLVGLICSIIGLNQIGKRKERGKGVAIAGIIVSVIVGLLQLLTLLLIVVAVNSTTVKLTTYRDSSLGYTVKYPEGWNVTPETITGGQAVLIKKGDDQTGKVVGQVEVAYIPPPANGYSKDVLQAIADGLKKDAKNTNVVYESRSTKNGMDTITLITTYDGENGTVKAKHTIMLRKDNSVFTVSTQTPEQNWDKYQNSFDTIHNTFQP